MSDNLLDLVIEETEFRESVVPSGDPDDPYPEMCDGEAPVPQWSPPSPPPELPSAPRDFNIFPSAFTIYIAVLFMGLIALVAHWPPP